MRKLVAYFCLCTLFLGCLNLESKKKENVLQELSANEIMQRAHQKAGGEFWRRPQSLTLKGYGIFYKDGDSVIHEKHHMWRVFEAKKSNAHKANGKVRIESFQHGKPVFIVSFDGQHTYDLNGKQEPSAADQRWASNFGYGAIRHALDEGYELQIQPDDTIASRPVYRIKVIDENKGETYFGIDKEDFKIVKVAFDTPKGWHERIYSKFFSKPEYSWLQSGQVRLYYNNTIANTIIWEDFEVNEKLPDSLFVLKTMTNDK